MSSIATKFIAFTRWYIGRLEKSGNSGFKDPAFEKEMVGAGWRLKDPWCATFIRMVALKLFTGKLRDAIKAQFNASAKQTFDNVKKEGVFKTGNIPKEGAVVVWLHGHGSSGHMGMVDDVDLANNVMTCVEGNTNKSGSREGDRVAEKLRTIDRPFRADGLNVYGYIYLDELL